MPCTEVVGFSTGRDKFRRLQEFIFGFQISAKSHFLPKKLILSEKVVLEKVGLVMNVGPLHCMSRYAT